RQTLPARGRGLKPGQLRPDADRRQSLPARERGLKHRSIGAQLSDGVAPRPGAWVETLRLAWTVTSSPGRVRTRERGLKRVGRLRQLRLRGRSHTRARVETTSTRWPRE